MAGAFHRLADTSRLNIEISIDGHQVQVLDGDTVLTAILLHHDHLRLSDIGGDPRAGFCLMGACQDCWVSDGAGHRLRACTSYVRPGLAILTGRGDFTPAKPVPAAPAATVPVPTQAEPVADAAAAGSEAAAGADTDNKPTEAAKAGSDDIAEEGRS